MKTKTFSFATTLLLPFVSSLLSFIFCLLSLPTTAQVPQGFKYQAALRDDGGKIIANQLVSMRITISNSSGTLYAEEHISTTTDYGLVHLNIGKGHVLSGVFIGIDWSADEHFMQLEVNTGGGYVDMGTTQLLSVPYALHAGSATSLTGPVSESDPVFTASPSFGITMAHIDNWQSAYSWGDHAMAGYLTSFSEADPLFSLSPSYGIASSDISNWNSAFGWGDHDAAGYLTSFSEADPTWNGAANTGSTIGRTGNVGIGTTSPKALLHTHGTGSGEGNVLFTGSYKDTPGDPPATGAGTRMMWYPDKAAFRAGIVTGTHWDKDSIGVYSVALGWNTVAKGNKSTALGWGTTASGAGSTSMGFNTKSSGYASVAMGEGTTASGYWSTAMGIYTIASGSRSTAIGNGTIARSGWEVAVGSYNTDYSPNSTSQWSANDRLFVIGNGTGSGSSSSNAMTVLKNGRVGLQSITSPTFALHLPDNTSDGIGKGRANAWTTYSDGRVKSGKAPIEYGLKEIMMLEPLKYFKNNSTFRNGALEISTEGINDIGFIAQDMYHIIPEIVDVPEDENTDLWGMNYEKLTPVMVKAIQEQQAEIDDLKKIVQQQQAQISSLINLVNLGADVRAEHR